MEEQKIKILCVEDEREIRENIVEILRDEGFEVFGAANGKEGFEVFSQHNPDIVVSDIMMPQLDGYGLLKMIRESKLSRYNSVPFIFLSALGQKENIIKGVDLSANDYLVKPVDFDLMISKIREKTSNARKVQEIQENNIKNIKEQVAVALPSEASSLLEIITQIADSLRKEPYGPLPHRRYVEDFDKIYINALKLRSVISNALDSSNIDQKLNLNEEIISVSELIKQFVKDLDGKFQNHIFFEEVANSQSEFRIKLDRLLLFDAFKQIVVGFFSADPSASLKISSIINKFHQMVFIFYLNSSLQKIDLSANIEESKIGKILDKQNCRFEILETRPNTALLIFPAHRLIQKN